MNYLTVCEWTSASLHESRFAMSGGSAGLHSWYWGLTTARQSRYVQFGAARKPRGNGAIWNVRMRSGGKATLAEATQDELGVLGVSDILGELRVILLDVCVVPETLIFELQGV